jgi:hypothetical protein
LGRREVQEQVTSTTLHACVALLRADLKKLRSPHGWSLHQIVRVIENARYVRNAFRALPVIRLEVGQGSAGRSIGRHLNHRFIARPIGRAHATLILPDTYDRYLKGRSRQALRTNLVRASRQGTTVDPIDSSKLIQHVQRLLADDADIPYLHELMLEVPGEGVSDWVARSTTGAIIGIARLQIDNKVAWLKFFCASRDGAASTARYLLFGRIVEDLISRGVNLILVDLQLRGSPGLAYFQDRLGFRPVRVELMR